jgi:phage head-tail adaptor, putative, SPP1 family
MKQSVTIILQHPHDNRNDAGFIDGKNPTAKKIFAFMKSAVRDEFYKAQSIGRRVDRVFEVKSFEYSGETEVIYNGDTYDVVRDFALSLDDLELVCAKR